MERSFHREGKRAGGRRPAALEDANGQRVAVRIERDPQSGG
jgi:hypothetical protein